MAKTHHILLITFVLASIFGCKKKAETSSASSTFPGCVEQVEGGALPTSSQTLCTNTAKSDDLTPEAELQLIRDAYKHAVPLVKEKYPGLGDGWSGNQSGSGPKCNVVHDEMVPIVRTYIQERLAGKMLKHYVPVSLFDSGWAPFDMAAHIYMGIGTKPKAYGEIPQLISWLDPWRYGNATFYKPGTGPNTPDEIIPSM